MSIQRATGLILFLVSVATAGYNSVRLVYNYKPDLVLGLAFALVGAMLFLTTMTKERLGYKIVQSFFIALVSSLTIRLNEEPLIGAFFMLVAFALWYEYGFYERQPVIMIAASVVMVFIPLCMVYDTQRALITTVGIFGALLVFALVIRGKMVRHRREVNEITNIARDALNELRQERTAHHGDTAGKV